MANAFEIMISNLKGLGIFDYFFPFVFFLAVIYGILENTKVFGEQKSIHAVIAIISSMLIIYTGKEIFLTGVFETLSLFVVGIFVVILIASMMGMDIKSVFAVTAEGKGKTYIVIAIVSGVVIMAGQNPLDLLPFDFTTFMTLLFIILMALAVIYIGQSSK